MWGHTLRVLVFAFCHLSPPQLILCVHLIAGCNRYKSFYIPQNPSVKQIALKLAALLCFFPCPAPPPPGLIMWFFPLLQFTPHTTSTVWTELQDHGTCVRKCQHSRNKRLFHLHNCSLLRIKLTQSTAGGSNLYPSDLDNNTIGKFIALITTTAILSLTRGWTQELQS